MAQHPPDGEAPDHGAAETTIRRLRGRTIATLVVFGIAGVLLILVAASAGDYQRDVKIAGMFVFCMLMVALGQLQDEQRARRAQQRRQPPASRDDQHA